MARKTGRELMTENEERRTTIFGILSRRYTHFNMAKRKSEEMLSPNLSSTSAGLATGETIVSSTWGTVVTDSLFPFLEKDMKDAEYVVLQPYQHQDLDILLCCTWNAKHHVFKFLTIIILIKMNGLHFHSTKWDILCL